MRLSLSLSTLLFAAGALAQEAVDQTARATPANKPVKTVKAPASPTIPKDATPLADGSFRHVDAKGKAWIYRNTPFGVSKAEERPAPAAIAPVGEDKTTMKDLGGAFEFTSPTPFGNKVWTKKKDELDSYEKSVVRKYQPAAPAPGTESPATAAQ